MTHPDRECQLIFDPNPSPASCQAAELCEFLRRSLPGGMFSLSDVESKDQRGSNLSSSLAAPLVTPHHLIVFDIPSLMRCRDLTKSAILAPQSVRHHLGGDSPQASMADLAEIQQALHCTENLLLFDPHQMIPLLTLGAHSPVIVPMPANTSGPRADHPLDLLIIDHNADQTLLHEAMRSFRGIKNTAQRLAYELLEKDKLAAPDAAIHLHIGSGLDDQTAPRIIDSLAQRKLVIHLVDLDSQIAEPGSARAQMTIDHNSSGLRINDPADAAVAVLRLMADQAMADLFRRNGDRTAARFNSAVASAMLDALQ